MESSVIFLLAILGYLLQNGSVAEHCSHIVRAPCWTRTASRTSLAAVLLNFSHFIHTTLHVFVPHIQLQNSASCSIPLVRNHRSSYKTLPAAQYRLLGSNQVVRLLH